MSAISSRQFKNKWSEILNREITDYDLIKLYKWKIIKRIRFKNNFYYQEIEELTNILPTIIEVLK